MPAPQRQPGAGVIQHLLDEPYRFQFFQAVRLIEQWLREHGIDGGLAHAVRFGNSTALGFPASEIEAIDAAGLDAAALIQALRHGALRLRIRPAFMGLLGVAGALPLHYTETLALHEHACHDDGPRAFLDLLSTRALALFYEGWTKYRVRMGASGAPDRYLPLLLAFAGVPAPAGQGASGQYVLARFAAQVAGRVVSPPVLGGVLATYFQVPVVVEPFAGMWDVLAPDLQTGLGAGSHPLGAGATAGCRIWRCDLCYRVRIGPVARRDFDRFLPGAAGALALARLLAEFSIGVPHCEVHLLLRSEAVKGAHLDGQARLGLDSFVLGGRALGDRGDVRFRLPQP